MFLSLGKWPVSLMSKSPFMASKGPFLLHKRMAVCALNLLLAPCVELHEKKGEEARKSLGFFSSSEFLPSFAIFSSISTKSWLSWKPEDKESFALPSKAEKISQPEAAKKIALQKWQWHQLIALFEMHFEPSSSSLEAIKRWMENPLSRTLRRSVVATGWCAF